jgi:hypothetical protein
MRQRLPVAAQPLGADVTTVRPDGRPHVMPLLGSWQDDTSSFIIGETTRKGEEAR